MEGVGVAFDAGDMCLYFAIQVAAPIVFFLMAPAGPLLGALCFLGMIYSIEARTDPAALKLSFTALVFCLLAYLGFQLAGRSSDHHWLAEIILSGPWLKSLFDDERGSHRWVLGVFLAGALLSGVSIWLGVKARLRA